MDPSAMSAPVSTSMVESRTTNIFRAEFDEEGVYVYQAFRDSIADYALAHGRFGGPDFNPARITWINPSFACMLYRCGYGHKDQNQKRILKIKVPHEVMAEILRECSCQHGGGGSVGRVQWDPERDLWHAERVTSRKGVNVETAGCLPDTAEADTTRKLIVQPAKIGTIAEDVRSIQIGISKELSQRYCTNVLEILDMADLAHAVGAAHNLTRDEEVTAALEDLQLPTERVYVPHVSDADLIRLKLKMEQGEGIEARRAPCRSES